MKHCSLFKEMHFPANDQLKHNNTINTCLINLNIILYSLPLNIHEY